jgi:hypothetical protein
LDEAGAVRRHGEGSIELTFDGTGGAAAEDTRRGGAGDARSACCAHVALNVNLGIPDANSRRDRQPGLRRQRQAAGRL